MCHRMWPRACVRTAFVPLSEADADQAAMMMADCLRRGPMDPPPPTSFHYRPPIDHFGRVQVHVQVDGLAAAAAAAGKHRRRDHLPVNTSAVRYVLGRKGAQRLNRAAQAAAQNAVAHYAAHYAEVAQSSIVP